MAPINLPYLKIYVVRGQKFVYFRKGAYRVRLRANTDSPEFLAEYEAARRKAPAGAGSPATPGGPIPGSLRALVVAYRSSSAYRRLADGSRDGYDRLIDGLLEDWGHLPVDQMPRAWVLERQDEWFEKPRAANYRVSVIRRLMSFAVDRGWRTDNPALRIQPLETGPGHRPWTAAELAAMTGDAAGDVALPVLLAYHTAQRQADILRLLWSAYNGASISLRQEKTKAEVVIPVDLSLRRALDAMPRTAAVICTTSAGRPWKSDWFKHRFAAVRAALGLPDDLHFHGLRHTAGRDLAEAGASEAEIKSITGHRSAAMVARYTAGARQEEMAKSGMAKRVRKRTAKRVRKRTQNT